jgi:hypothetical protein
MTLDQSLIQMMDDRIRLHDQATSLMGTVVTRDTSGTGATVLFDGSIVAAPVKCMGHVHCRPGDRVALSLHGSDWLIYGSFSGPGYGEASSAIDGLPSTTGGLTSSSFTDLTEFGTFVFTKFYDNTFVRMGMSVGAYVTTAGDTRVAWGLRLSPTSGAVGYTATDYRIVYAFFHNTTVHQSASGMWRNLSIPAGTYTVSARWRRASGSGTIFADANDYYSVELDERIRAGSPIL